MRVYVQEWVHVRASMCVRACACVSIACTCVCVRARVCECVRACASMYMRVPVQACGVRVGLYMRVQACACARMHVLVCVCEYVRECVRVYMCMCVCASVYVRVCASVCTAAVPVCPGLLRWLRSPCRVRSTCFRHGASVSLLSDPSQPTCQPQAFGSRRGDPCHIGVQEQGPGGLAG